LNLTVHTVVTGPFQENTFLLVDNSHQELLFIDPGDDPERLVSVVEQVKAIPVAILNTHAHIDHVSAVEVLRSRYRIPFYLHHGEKPILDHFEEMASFLGIAAGKPPEVDVWIEKEEVLTLGPFTLQVLETPGHTPGGVSYLVEDHLFVGDTLFHGSVGRTDLPGGDWPQLQKSLVKLLQTVDPQVVIHTGHGPDTTLEVERKQNPFLLPLEKQVN
jgi:glyoxylase-like metal-dependent hydrolase (beta-lactamase superfamily II)